MNFKSTLLSLTIIGCLQSYSIVVAAEPREGIELDPLTGNYTVSYFVELDDGRKLLQKTLFEPATKIDPSVKSKLRLGGGNVVSYRYAVSSSPRSLQILGTVRFQLTAKVLGVQELTTNNFQSNETQIVRMLVANKKALETPSGWNAGTHSNQLGGVRISWFSNGNEGVHPGNSITGFGFASVDIPGVGLVELVGVRKRRTTYAGDGPQGDIEQQFNAIRKNDFVPRNAAVPAIAVPDPFDAAILLDRIRAEIQTWPAKQLLDPAYAAQLDRYMVAAAEAYRLNNPKAGKEHIETLRKMLAKEHHNLDRDEEDSDDVEERKAATRFTIGRLAARVLDFDLRYVLKRLESDEDEHKKR